MSSFALSDDTMTNVCAHCCTKIENLSVKFGSHAVLENINLHLNCHELLVLIGPNGAGKTTLLRAISGEIPYSGAVHYLVRSNPVKKPRIGYVPQKLHFDQGAPISVMDLLAMSLSRGPVWLHTRRSIRNNAEMLLKKTASEKLIDRKIGQLSGGELQRVLLAVALTPVPDMLLLDEAVSTVDLKGLQIFYEVVTRLKEEFDISIIMATHDLTGIAPYADRMVLMNRVIVSDGAPRDVLSDKLTLETFRLSL
ncbi:MAG: metal ABC transporter ATP-binding protein [Candidatus Omnitrophica bacterium]|nr:metal ABC transporter ATP-binding protein [Candidatus Omnitrophota bacterium]